MRIRNYDAVDLYKVKIGLADFAPYKKTMMDDSLLARYIGKSNISENDMICIKFEYGLPTYDKEKNYLKKYEERDNTKKLLELLERHEDTYKPVSIQEIRTEFYQNGIVIDDNKYVYLYRSSAKAKQGSAMFINEQHYTQVKSFMEMGIVTDKVVEIEAYKALVASSIIDTVSLRPEQILIIKDEESTISKKIKSVEIQNDKCVVVDTKQELTNVLWDGQSLADESLFESTHSMMLLRNHFFKSCAFRCDIQAYMKDNGIEQCTDMFGVNHKAEDIKLICSESSCKWLKFGSTKKDYLKWSNVIEQNGNEFGVVKTEHESKWGNKQRLSYQMINSLPADKEQVEDICEYTFELVKNMKNDNVLFGDYLYTNKNLFNSYEMLLALYGWNHGIANTNFFRKAKSKIINDFINKKVKMGKVLVEGDNMTVCSNPLEMLQYATTGHYVSSFKSEKDAVQCHTTRFKESYLCAFRNPHNAPNNVLHFHNVKMSSEFEKYFRNLTPNIIVVNSIHTDVQDRANSMDFDSDFVLVSNQSTLVELAKECYLNYPTIVNNIGKKTLLYRNTAEQRAEIDIKFAELQKIVGESTNLAQLCLSYYWTYKEQKYYDSFVILSVLAQVAIDSVKREFDVDMKKVLNDIRMQTNIKQVPEFYALIQKAKEEKVKKAPNSQKEKVIEIKINKNLICPMNHVLSMFKKMPRTAPTETENIMDYFIKATGKPNNKQMKIIREKSEKAMKIIRECENVESHMNIDNLIRQLKKISCSNPKTINRLIELSLQEKEKYSMVLLSLLFQKNPLAFLKNFKRTNS